MRGMRPAELLAGFDVLRPPLSVNNGLYVRRSTATYVLASSQRSGCTGGRRADHIRIVSTVTYPGQGTLKPVRIESLAAPPVGGASPLHGKPGGARPRS
jgi:hypothetical protein